MKKIILVVFICIIYCLNLQATEEKLNPYQDYLFIIIHGINDLKNSFEGTNPEWLDEMNKARDINLPSRKNVTMKSE